MPFLNKSSLLIVLCVAPACAVAQNIVGEVFASDAAVRGSVVLVGGGTQVLSGSQVAAGASSALLRLKRGGDVRICPGTDLSVATSPEGSSLMLSLSAGSIETNYRVNAVADTILTPDFKMQMIGPGVFHLAIAANAKGDTCVRPLESNTASVIVTELMGNGTYQVKPAESIVFLGGKIAAAQNSVMEGCGCPVAPPVQQARNVPDEPAMVSQSQAASQDTAVQVDAPFVFRGADAQAPDMAYGLASLKTRSTKSLAVKLQPTVVPPDEQLLQDVKKIEDAKALELQRGLDKQIEKRRAQEAARMSAAQKAEQARKDKELARQAEAAKKEQVKQEKERARAAEFAASEQAKQAAANARAAARAKHEQQKKYKVDAQKAEIARKEQQKKDKADARQAEIAKAATRKQEARLQKQQSRENKIATAEEQKRQQILSARLESAREQQLKQEQEAQRQAELAAKNEHRRVLDAEKAQQAAKAKAEAKGEPNVIRKIGSFFGRLFKG